MKKLGIGIMAGLLVSSLGIMATTTTAQAATGYKWVKTKKYKTMWLGMLRQLKLAICGT